MATITRATVSAALLDALNAMPDPFMRPAAAHGWRTNRAALVGELAAGLGFGIVEEAAAQLHSTLCRPITDPEVRALLEAGGAVQVGTDQWGFPVHAKPSTKELAAAALQASLSHGRREAEKQAHPAATGGNPACPGCNHSGALRRLVGEVPPHAAACHLRSHPDTQQTPADPAAVPARRGTE